MENTVTDIKRILVIEDEMAMRFFLVTLFETNGFSPVMARNGKEGIQKAKEIHPDIIVLDVMMPEEGGAQVYRKLKSENRLQDIPVVILSGVEKHTFYHYLKMLGVSEGVNIPLPDSYIEKPPEPQHLLNTIKKLI